MHTVATEALVYVAIRQYVGKAFIVAAIVTHVLRGLCQRFVALAVFGEEYAPIVGTVSSAKQVYVLLVSNIRNVVRVHQPIYRKYAV
jgi:hypothetical protein